MRLVVNSKRWRDRQAKMLLFWRKEIRWKCQSNSGFRCHDCSHVRRPDQELFFEIESNYKITPSSFYRAIKECNLIKSKWSRCPKCHTLHLSRKKQCQSCTRQIWHTKKQTPGFTEKQHKRYQKYRNLVKSDPKKLKHKKETRKAYYNKQKKEGLHLEHKYRRRARLQKAKIAGEQIKRPDKGTCHYCGKKVSGKELHLDHVVPLYMGGAHASYNLVVSCYSCNCSKSTKMPNQWTPSGQLEMVLQHA